ncbi:MAG: hypothetical protein MJ181_08160 [Treponema sp.]|nr:hypothetical protein [Treponema sp.]
MKKILTSLFAISFSFVLFAETPFTWKESSWNTGTMYEYRVTGEGKKGIDLYVYVKDDHTVSYFADQSEYAKQVFVYEDSYDKKTGYVIESNGKNPLSYARESFTNIESHVSLDASSKKLRMWGSAWFLGKEKSMDVELNLPVVPWTETSSFFSELWFMMRNLNSGTTSFDISISSNGKVSPAKVKLEGTEIINGVECDKWSVTGKKENHNLWFEKGNQTYPLIKYSSKGTGGYVKSPDVSFVKTTMLTSFEWEIFCKVKTETARTKLKLPENK